MSTYNGVTYAMAPPDGGAPDPDQQYQATSMIVIIAIFLPLAVVTVAIRTYTRAVISRKFAFDDFLMVVATLLSVVMAGLCLDMVNYGLGKDLWNVPLEPDLYPNWMLRNVVAAMVFCLATGFAKGSILLFYLRIFPSASMKLATWSVFGFTVAYSLASVFVNVFSCSPIQGSWVLSASLTATCIDRPAFYFAQAGLGIAADIATVVLPLPKLKSLQLKSKQKIGVAVVLTMGAFVCIVSIIRLQSLYVLLAGANLTINTVTALMWCCLELNLSIIGGSIAALKPFAQRHFPGLLGSTGNSRNRSNTGALSLGSRNHTYGANSRYSKSKHASRVATEYDTGSEEYIMHNMPGAMITKTVQYGFQVEEDKNLAAKELDSTRSPTPSQGI
ncbi:hypothetical protein BX600DRAFT_485513 [Xylariales sp. PMI_506]|nr:hypothetical protein BX600DRAFT_485513 [Xylariales sp. PMI_506]